MRKFYEKKLKRKIFDTLRRNQQEYSKLKSNWLKAEQFEMKYLKMRVYSKWSEKLDDKNEIKKLHLYCKARQHHERHLTRNCFKQWLEFKSSQQVLNVKIEFKMLWKLFEIGISICILLGKTR